MDGVKVALGIRGMTVEAARRSVRVERHGTYVTELSFTRQFLCGTVFFRTALPCSIITWKGEGCRNVMRLGLTVNMEQLLKINLQVTSKWAKGCMLMILCV